MLFIEMRKVKHYPEDAFDFHKKVVATKRFSDKKEILQSLEQDIEECYKTYNKEFASNTLYNLHPLTLSSENSDLLTDLYQFKQSTFQNLFITLTTTESNQRDMLCPYCTITDCNQLDHYIPKSTFPEFSANPRNLMQCCSRCNQKKRNLWLNNNAPIFLNLYLDELPQEQYLFVDTTIEKVPEFEFYLSNRSNIDTMLFSRIESHYRALDLCRRFKEKVDSVFSNIIVDYSSALKVEITPSNFWQMKRESAIKYQRTMGKNYWKSIFILECCQNQKIQEFIDSKIQ